MSTLVVQLDGVGDDFLRESMDAGRAACLAFILRAGGVAYFQTPEIVEPTVNCISALTGVWADQHRILGRDELDGTGILRPVPALRRAVETVPEIADRQGKRCLLVNFPFVGAPCTEGTVAVTDRFFASRLAANETHAPVHPADLLADLPKLLIAPTAVSDAHLAQLSPGLLELALTDPRRTLAVAILARALSIQNIVTALAETDTFDLI